MRSREPVPGNPWPHDMVLRIDDAAQIVTELLWVREAWGLQPPGDVPPPPEIRPEPAPSTQSLRRDKREWESAWARLWADGLTHLGRPQDPTAFDRMREAPPGSEERRRLLRAFVGPSWRDAYGDDAFGEEHRVWLEALARRSHAEHGLPLDQHPERRSLDATIAAWERGLLQIVTIPCVGEYTRTIGEHGLCVTRATRADPERYRRALLGFGR